MLYIITRDGCPYCAAAKENMEQLMQEDAQLRAVPIRFLAEAAATEQYDFYYAPAYFWDKEKLAEGEFTSEELRGILFRAHSRMQGRAE